METTRQRRQVVTHLLAAFQDLLCAVAATANGYRDGTLFSRTTSSRRSATRTRVSTNWASILSSGQRIGPSTAVVTIVEFGDFECPACAGFARRVEALRKKYPSDFAVVFHHFPLAYHRSAYPLARAAECAASQGRFAQFYDAVYTGSDSASGNSISHLAHASGVADTLAFVKCSALTVPVAAIDSGLALGRRLGVDGTPGILVEGELWSVPPSTADLEEIIQKKAREGWLVSGRRN